MQPYLSQSTFSKLMRILFGVPQRPILGLPLVVIYICDLLILNDNLEFGSYADDTTPFVYGKHFDEILGELQKYMTKICEWFLHNRLKTNANKFHLFLDSFIDKAISIKNFDIKSRYAEINLGVTIDTNLSFSEHATYLCLTANRKLHALHSAHWGINPPLKNTTPSSLPSPPLKSVNRPSPPF